MSRVKKTAGSVQTLEHYTPWSLAISEKLKIGQMATSGETGLNWLIVEDGLRDLHGHFLDFVTTFVRGLEALGDRVTVMCAQGAPAGVLELTGALPLMPSARWRTGSLRRPASVLGNIYWLCASLFVLLRQRKLIDQSDLIFLTGTKVQHLILWRIYSAIMGRAFQTPLLLFFMATPVRKRVDGDEYEWEGFLGRLFGALVRSLSAGRNGSRIRFATETEQLTNCLSDLSGARFETMPQPVEPDPRRPAAEPVERKSRQLTIGSFGPPREEKGSHLLIMAIAKILEEDELENSRFIVQWTQDFRCENGDLAKIPVELRESDRFHAIKHYFEPGEYEDILADTDAIVLPYGANYNLRGSRVLIDALVRGLPVAVTKGSSMQTLAESYGSCVVIEELNVNSVAASIRKLHKMAKHQGYQRSLNTAAARSYFSVRNFRSLVRTFLQSDACQVST
jgi:glycosyltransferase involved in cell wall biosynthesis